jgi:hypothetical protein
MCSARTASRWKDIIVRAWEGNRWHVDITPGLSERYAVRLPHGAAAGRDTATCLGCCESAIEQHFAVDVTLEQRMRDVHVLTNTNVRGQMLRRYPDPEPGTGFSLAAFSASWAARRRAHVPA